MMMEVVEVEDLHPSQRVSTFLSVSQRIFTHHNGSRRVSTYRRWRESYCLLRTGAESAWHVRCGWGSWVKDPLGGGVRLAHALPVRDCLAGTGSVIGCDEQGRSPGLGSSILALQHREAAAAALRQRQTRRAEASLSQQRLSSGDTLDRSLYSCS